MDYCFKDTYKVVLTWQKGISPKDFVKDIEEALKNAFAEKYGWKAMISKVVIQGSWEDD